MATGSKCKRVKTADARLAADLEAWRERTADWTWLDFAESDDTDVTRPLSPTRRVLDSMRRWELFPRLPNYQVELITQLRD